MTTKPVVQGLYSATLGPSNVTLYTVPAGQEASISLYVSNPTSSAIVTTISVASNPILGTVSVPANSSIIVKGIKAPAGSSVTGGSGVNGIALTISVMLRNIPQ